MALVCPIYDLITLFAWGMEAYMTLLRVGLLCMLDEDLLGRKSGVSICFRAYLSNINPLLFFFFLQGFMLSAFLAFFCGTAASARLQLNYGKKLCAKER